MQVKSTGSRLTALFAGLLAAVLLFPPAVSAKNIYKYQDENGIWHFTDRPPEDEPLLDALIRDVKARQSLIKSELLDDDEVEPLRFIGSATMADGVERLKASIQSELGLALDDYRKAQDVDEAFGLLRSSAEDAGVFVLLLGNLGSHHTNIDLDTFRGFALADDVAPFLVINDQDHHGAWLSLIHISEPTRR